MSAERALHVAPNQHLPEALALLLERAGRGDQSAFAGVYDATSARTVGLALHVLGDRAEAEELLFDAYVEIWRRCGRFEARSVGAMAWILMIVHRAAAQRVRCAALERDEAPHTPGDAATSRRDPAPVAKGVRIVECGTGSPLSELGEEQRAAVTLAYFAAHTHEEVDHVLGFAPGRALSLIRGGLDRLRERPELA